MGESSDSSEKAGTDGPGLDDGDATTSRMGPAPRLLGGDRMRNQIAAALFGDVAPKAETDAEAKTLAAVETRDDGYDDLEDSIVEDRLGRFRVLELLGRGGMGVVYSAYDPQLDRKVAIKVLRPDVHKGLGHEAATARLLREAQAMAKLNDPHVIVVHEVGTLNDRVFVAMEFVQGQTLGQWMSKRPPWREVLAIFIRAGSGLAAAHKAGLVHRDFKPENVLMGDDGRVRVVDFGLARSVLDEEAEERRPERGEDEEPELDSLNTPLTRTGAVMGTPAYMSPEQHLGRPADARSDQYSFCVALFEALHGQRPFLGKSLGELTGNVLDGRLSEPPHPASVPRWISAAVRRGLSRNPDDRFPDMEALLDELRRDPRRKWVLGGMGVAVTGLAVFIGIGAYQRYLTGECDALVSSMSGVWNDQSRAAVSDALSNSGVPWGKHAAETTTHALDQHADEWKQVVQNECASSQVGSEEARQTWHNKRLCFEDNRDELAQLVEQLAEPSEEMATTALLAAVQLTDVKMCTDPRRLAMWEALADKSKQERLGLARERLVRARTQGTLGHWQKAVETSTAVIEDARDLGVPALEAAGLVVRAVNYFRAEQNPDKAEEDLRLAATRAKEAGDPGTHALALIHLVYMVSREPRRWEEARLLGERAREVIQSLGSEPSLEAHLNAYLGVAARVARKFDESREYSEKALATRRELLGDEHPDTLRARYGLGVLLCRQKNEEGLEHLQKAVDGYQAVFGGDHPELGTVMSAYGTCLARLSRYDEALAMQAKALEIYKRDLDPDDQRILTLEYNMAFIHHMNGDHEEALKRARAGMPRAERLLESRPTKLAEWKALLAMSLDHVGEPQAALAMHKETLALFRRADAPRFRILETQVQIAGVTLELDEARGRVLLEELGPQLADLEHPEDLGELFAAYDELLKKAGLPPRQ